MFDLKMLKLLLGEDAIQQATDSVQQGIAMFAAFDARLSRIETAVNALCEKHGVELPPDIVPAKADNLLETAREIGAINHE